MHDGLAQPIRSSHRGIGRRTLRRLTWSAGALLLAACLSQAHSRLPGRSAIASAAGPVIDDDPSPARPARIPEPDLKVVPGFPAWVGRGGKLDRPVVVVEGMDLHNEIGARDLMQMAAPAVDYLMARGVSLVVVNFPDARPAPDQLAPMVARAVRATSASAGGREVALVGFSAGGIVARWAMASAENQGDPLPVHTLALVDSPNRGFWLNPGLQAITMRYGKQSDRDAMTSPMARAMFDCRPKDVQWKRKGLGPFGRVVPVHWSRDTSDHDAFFQRLRALNDRGGYPHCPLIFLACGSRRGKGGAGDLLHLWLPFGARWTLDAEPEDREPGSLLPPQEVARFSTSKAHGMAGAYLRHAPTCLPTDSAMDAAPGESAPFGSPSYALDDDQPPPPHGVLTQHAAGELVVALWKAVERARSSSAGGSRSHLAFDLVRRPASSGRR